MQPGWQRACLACTKLCIQSKTPHKPSAVGPVIQALRREAGRSEIQGHSLLQNECEATLGFMRPCLKKKKKRREGEDMSQ